MVSREQEVEPETRECADLDLQRVFKLGEDFNIIRKIGAGSYGTVCKAIYKPTEKTMAIKKIENPFDNVGSCKRILREAQILQKLGHHKNIVELQDIFKSVGDKDESFNTINLGYEYMQADLTRVLNGEI